MTLLLQITGWQVGQHPCTEKYGEWEAAKTYDCHPVEFASSGTRRARGWAITNNEHYIWPNLAENYHGIIPW